MLASKRGVHMKSGRIIYIAIIGFVFCYLIFSMIRFDEGNGGRQAESVKQIIDKALVQVYALEGSYPTNIDHLTRYGVIIDKTKYIYHYDMIAINMKPSVIILAR